MRWEFSGKEPSKARGGFVLGMMGWLFLSILNIPFSFYVYGLSDSGVTEGELFARVLFSIVMAIVCFVTIRSVVMQPPKARVVERYIKQPDFIQVPSSKEVTHKQGYVYVIKGLGTAWYKIGRSKYPDDRVRTFNVHMPFDVAYEILFETDDMYALERILHQAFASRRANGEWFALTPDDLQSIRDLAESETE